MAILLDWLVWDLCIHLNLDVITGLFDHCLENVFDAAEFHSYIQDSQLLGLYLM